MPPETTADVTKLKLNRELAPIRARRRRRWLWWALVVVLIAAAGAWYALQPKVVTVNATPIVTTFPSQQFVVLNATGYVVAQRKAAISSKATGRVEWLGVAEGSRVKAGDIIARIDARDVIAQSESAEANVRAAKAAHVQAQAEETDALAQLKRQQELLAKNYVSPAAVDTAKARADRATAAVANAKANINAAEATARNSHVAVDYTIIRAPFDGVILSKTANVGDLVTPFSNAAESKGAVVSMADMSTLEVEADVSESSLAKIKTGQPAEIVLDALPDSRFRGRISRMVPTIDRAKATVMTKVKFDEIDPRILPEMSAKVSFLSKDITPEQQKPLIAVNPDAITQRDGKTVVFVIRDAKAVAVPVTPGAKIGEVTAITGAVKSGEKAVANPPATLANDALVKVAAK